VNGFDTTYLGPVEELSKGAADILAGKEVVITASAGRVREKLYDDEQTPIVRDWLHGQKGRVRRIRASLKLIDDKAIAAAGERYVVGRGVGGKEAVPRLEAALKHAEAGVRAEAAEDLGQIGAEAKSAVSALRKALDDGDGFVRVFAAEALWRIDPDNKESLPTLLKAMGSKQTGVRAAAVAALLAVGAPGRGTVPQLTVVLREDRDADTRAVSAFALGRLGPESDDPACPRRDVVRALGKALRQDKDESVRKWAASALLKFGPDAKPALADLRAALMDKSEGVAMWAIVVLSRLGPDGSAALAAALGEKGCRQRDSVAYFLGDLGPHSKDLVPALRKALDDEDAGVRWAAADALLRIDPDTGARLAVPVLARLAADKDYESRKYVLESLIEIGPPARAAVPTLIEILKAKQKYRGLAARALGRIGPDARAAVPALVEALDSDKDGVGYAAAEALGRIGPDARSALPALRAKLTSPEGRMAQIYLAVALARIGDKRYGAAVLAEIALHSTHESARESALRALGEIGPTAASVLPALKKALRDEGNRERCWVAFAVWRIGRRVESGGMVLDERLDAVEALTALIRVPDHRWGLDQVADVVHLLGPDAAPLAPALAAVVKDQRPGWGLALGALEATGSAGGAAAPVLAAVLKEHPAWADVAVTLASLGRSDLAAPAVPVVIKWVESGATSGPRRRYQALAVLEALGRGAKPAVALLLRLMRHEDYDLYVRAARALVVIDPEAAARVGLLDAPRESPSRQTGVTRLGDD
jgi:HEAT repeat protein